MKDIKSLYRAAKMSGKQTDISAYSEAVQELFESNPNDYISNLEYIIQSDIGLKTLKEFVETHGLPIACYDNVMSLLESCIEKCKERDKDSSAYEEATTFMEEFRHKYIGCFMMESYFHDKLPDDYVSIYYGKNSSGIPNRKLAAGLIGEFAEGAIPDAIITADSLGGNALDTVLSIVESNPDTSNPVTYEWVLECVKNIVPDHNPIMAMMESQSISSIVRDVQTRNTSIYRESLITGEDRMMEYSEDELEAFEEFISFNEYKALWAEDLNESVNDIQSTIYSLYQEIADILDENGDPIVKEESIADNIVPMLPGSGAATPIKERLDVINTRNKKTGEIPGYLKNNHNLGYGEDDDNAHASLGTGSHEVIEPTLDDFKRPSAIEVDAPYSGLDDDKDKTSEKDMAGMTPAEKQQAVNNYYYYTYNNSLNKNTSGSFNRDHSTHTSTKSSIDDHSVNRGAKINNSSSDDDKYEPLKESSSPWELDIFPRIFTESSNDSKPFLYTYRTVKAEDGKYYLITFDIDGPDVVNYKLHYADANEKSVKIVGTIPSSYLMKYGNDNYVSKGNIIRSITDIRSGREVKSIIASGGIPADGENIDKIGKAQIEYTVGGKSPLTYKSTVPIYPMLGTVTTSYGAMKGMNIKPNVGNVLNPFAPRRIDFSKPILYKDEYTQFGILLKPALLEIGEDIGSMKKVPIKDIRILLDEKIRANKLYDDYLIHPLAIEEYDRMLLMSAIFVKNCANNLMKKPWNSVPDIYKGLIVGFFGAPIGGSAKYINIDIMEPITSQRYRVDTNVFQNIGDWFTFIANCIATTYATDAEKSITYAKQEAHVRDLIKDTFFRKVFIRRGDRSLYESDGINEAVGDADDDRPESDHPVRDTLMDIDRKLVTKQQEVKKGVQDIQNVGRAFTKPAKRTVQWVDNMVSNWKDKDENAVKEKLADPHARANLFSAIKTSIKTGALFKAGLLLNPVFLVLSATRRLGKNKREFRLRNEMIGELKTEIEIIEEKIKDADRVGDNKAKYQMMRFKNEVNKKLLRVGGGPGWKKII